MFLNKFSIFLVFITLLGSVISCNVDEEDVNEVFTWEYVQGFGTGQTIQNYTSPEYSIVPSDTNLRIVGYPNTDDSLIINLGTLEGSELTIGEYKLGINDFFTLTFYKNGAVYEATDGAIDVTYINNRIDFNFEAEFSNGSRLSNGVADNLLIGNADTSSTGGVTPTPTPIIGTIEATVNGAAFLWDSLECSATFVTSTPQYLAIAGSSVSNTISMAFTDVDSPNKLSNLVGQTLQLSMTDNIINYVETGGGSPIYFASSSGEAKIVSYSDNVLTMTFSGIFADISDPTTTIPFENGEVKAIYVE